MCLVYARECVDVYIFREGRVSSVAFLLVALR